MGGACSRVVLAFGEDNIEPPEWETLNEGETEISISSNLKKLNNIQKRLMSKHILKDMLGDDGDHSADFVARVICIFGKRMSSSGGLLVCSIMERYEVGSSIILVLF